MYREKFDLTGSTALITGGGRGIGLAGAEALAEHGAKVILADYDAEVLKSGQAELAAKGYAAEAIFLDVTKPADVRRVADEVNVRAGGVDIMIANAGIALPDTPGEAMPDEDWLQGHRHQPQRRLLVLPRVRPAHGAAQARRHRHHRLDVGPHLQQAAAAGALQRLEGGCASPHQVAGGRVGELGVRINSIAPTYIDTAMSRGGFDKPELFPTWMDLTPMRRVGRPDEIAAIILFLASARVERDDRIGGGGGRRLHCVVSLGRTAAEPAMDEQSRRVDIIPAKRRAMILEWLRAHGAVSIQELANDMGGLALDRAARPRAPDPGGLSGAHPWRGPAAAAAARARLSCDSSITAHIDLPQKRAIGAEAANRVRSRESVIFEFELVTVIEAVRILVARGIACTAVTNSLDIAQLCAYAPAIRVVVPGGSVRPGSPLIVGEPGTEFLKSIHADLCLIGAYSISGALFTDAALEVASIKRAMIKASQRRIVLADSSKFRQPSFCTFCHVSEIEEVITDDGASAEDLEGLRATGVKVTVVPVKRESERGM